MIRGRCSAGDCIGDSPAIERRAMLMATGSHGELSRQSRPCPPDFEVIFVELGRLECEAHFRARRTTVTRWLEESGKAKLIRKRAEFVRHQRMVARAGKNGRAKPADQGKADQRKVDLQLVALAIVYLQRRENGGWVIVPNCTGYITGTRRRSAAEVVELAERKGFNRQRALEQIRAFAEPN
jgi:hypothetical protein